LPNLAKMEVSSPCPTRLSWKGQDSLTSWAGRYGKDGQGEYITSDVAPCQDLHKRRDEETDWRMGELFNQRDKEEDMLGKETRGYGCAVVQFLLVALTVVGGAKADTISVIDQQNPGPPDGSQGGVVFGQSFTPTLSRIDFFRN
jgi:hypothetical protein